MPVLLLKGSRAAAAGFTRTRTRTTPRPTRASRSWERRTRYRLLVLWAVRWVLPAGGGMPRASVGVMCGCVWCGCVCVCVFGGGGGCWPPSAHRRLPLVLAATPLATDRTACCSCLLPAGAEQPGAARKVRRPRQGWAGRQLRGRCRFLRGTLRVRPVRAPGELLGATGLGCKLLDGLDAKMRAKGASSWGAQERRPGLCAWSSLAAWRAVRRISCWRQDPATHAHTQRAR